MSIARIKVVSITSTKTNAGSDFYCNFQVVIDGETYGSAELAMTGTAGQQKVNIVSLRNPVDISKFSNEVFSFNIDEGGYPDDFWLPKSIYVLGTSTTSGDNSQDWTLLGGVASWPEFLWMGIKPASSTSAIIPLSGFNLAKVRSLV